MSDHEWCHFSTLALLIFSFYSKYRPLQVENLTITLELVSVMRSSMTIQDIAFVLDENTSKKGTFHNLTFLFKYKI